MYMHANKEELVHIGQELADSKTVQSCARQHGAVGDISAMKVCYLLRHYPNLSVSEIADLVGLSVSAASRCLTKLKTAEIVVSRKAAQTVRYRLSTSDFTKQLVAQMESQI